MFGLLNPNCIEGRHFWASEVPLICFNIVEWHLPARVLRQYGYYQTIPADARKSTDPKHMVSRRARRNWAHELREYIELWARRAEFVVVGAQEFHSDDEVQADAEYGPWFDRITRRYIQPQNDESQSYRPTAHLIPRMGRCLISNAQSAARIFQDPLATDVSREEAHKIFHLSVAELQEIGYENAVGVDPTQISFGIDAPDDEPEAGLDQEDTPYFCGLDQYTSQMTDEAGPSRAPSPEARRVSKPTNRYTPTFFTRPRRRGH